MKKISMLMSVVLLVLGSSCMNIMNSAQKRYYIQRAAQVDSNIESGEIEDIPGEVAPDDANSPFKNGAWNKIDCQFDGNKFKDWFFLVSFDDNTVPTYQFKNDSGHGAWTDGNVEKNEKISNSPDGANKAQGYGITGMTVHRYDGKNPLRGAASSYNAPNGRMERFYFYRIKGTAVVVGLDQHLIAVDSFSKFVFAYGKITRTITKAGKPVPTAFESLDAHEAVAGETAGTKRPFYHYDPIGFVKENGEVVLYEEYRNEMANSVTGQTNYFPQVHSKTRDIAKYIDANSPGRSPYFSEESSSSADAFAEHVARKTYKMRLATTYTYKNAGGEDVVATGNGFVLQTVQFDETGKKFTITKSDTETGTEALTSSLYTLSPAASSDSTRARYRDDKNNEIVITYDSAAVYIVGAGDSLEKQGELAYKDHGPDFMLRVRGAIFVNGGSKFTFSEDGGAVTTENMSGGAFRGDGMYYFVREKDAATKTAALYEWTGGSVLGIGSNPWYGLVLDDDDHIWRTTGTWNGSTPLWNGAYGSPVCERQLGEIEAAPNDIAFLEAVRGKTCSVRQKTTYVANGTEYTGNGWTVERYQFSRDGKTITYVHFDNTDYVENKTTATYTFGSSSSNTQAVYVHDGNAVQFRYDGSNLYKNEVKVGESNYTDPGPDFLLRVRGWTFEQGDTVYVFSADGYTLDMKWKPVTIFDSGQGTYTWKKDGNNATEAKYGRYGVRLVDDDRTIKMNNGYPAFRKAKN